MKVKFIERQIFEQSQCLDDLVNWLGSFGMRTVDRLFKGSSGKEIRIDPTGRMVPDGMKESCAPLGTDPDTFSSHSLRKVETMAVNR